MIQLLKNDGDFSGEVIGDVKIPIQDRNRDYSVIASDVQFNAKWNVSSLNNTDKLELSVDGTKYWLGYVNGIKKNWSERVYRVSARSGLNKLQEIKLERSALIELLNNTALFISVVITTTHSGDTINELNHGLSNDQTVQVRPQSGASLPTALQENKYYYAVVLDADNFKLSTLPGGLDIVSLAGGNGIWEIARDVDETKYFNNQAGSENANLEWICQKCFEASGFTLDTSSVTWEFVAGYDFDQIVMDVNQLWAINQDVAADYTVYDSTAYIVEKGVDRNANKINLLDFINIVLSWQGAGLKYIGSLTYKMNRDSGIISPSLKYDFDEETVLQESGTTYFKEVYNPSRSTYANPTEDEISTQDSNRTVNSEIELDYYTNLLFYRRISTTGVGTKIDAEDILLNKKLAKETTFTKETFKTDINVSVYNFRQNIVNLNTGKSEITQES